MLHSVDGKAKNNETVLAGTLRLADTLVVVLSGYIAYIVRTHNIDPPAPYLIAFLLSGILTLNILQFAKGYTLESLRYPFRGFGRVSLGWAAIFITLVTLSYATKTSTEFSRIWLGLWAAMSLLSLFLIRLLAAIRVARWHASGEAFTNLAIVGVDDAARRVAERVIQHDGAHIRIVGYINPADSAAETDPAVNVLGGLDDIVGLVRDGTIEELLIALPPNGNDLVHRITEATRNLPINVRLCLASPNMDLPIRGLAIFGGLPALNLWSPPLTAWDLVIKAIEDRILAAILLLTLTPVLAIIALAIKLNSSGPVLFRQRRAGFNNNIFTIYKFRTMTADRPSEAGVPQAERDDPRVTAVGRFLRRTSLDELPQIMNVLKGDMSLVGPRPHALEHDEHYAGRLDEYLGRQRVKPGITGWAQVNGLRGRTKTEEDMRRRVQYDLYYIDNWSVILDIKILALTLLVGFVNENAY